MPTTPCPNLSKSLPSIPCEPKPGSVPSNHVVVFPTGLQKPYSSPHNTTHNPKPRVLKHALPNSSTRSPTGIRSIICAVIGSRIGPIWQCPIQHHSLGPIHRPYIDQAAVLIRQAPIPQHRIQVRAIAIIITPARGVHLAQTRHGERLVLVLWLGGVGLVMVAVRVVPVIGVGAVEP